MTPEPDGTGGPAPTDVALVSGGSRGIGSAVVRRLAADGYALSFCYRSDRRAADELESELRGDGHPVMSAQIDVTDGDAVRDWVEATERFGPIATAVTSAGITRDGPLVTMPDVGWHHVIDTNLTGTYHVGRAVAFPMMKRRRGSIVNLSSVSGVSGNAGQTNYSASKAGIIGFSKALAKELGRRGVRVNAVAPGMIDTDMTGVLTDQARTSLLAAIPLGRFGGAEEVAELVAFLSGDRASYVTGSVFEVHGGIAI